MTDGPADKPAMRGTLLLMAAAVLWSTSGLFLKSPAMTSLPADERGPLVACYRGLIAGVALLPFINFRRLRFRGAMIPMVVCFASMNLLFISAMTYTTAAVAIFLQYTSTGWAFLFGVLFLKERVTAGNLVALVCGLLGIGWIVAGQWAGEQFFGTVLALGSGIAYAGVVVTLRSLREEDSAWLVSLNLIISGLVLLPWVISRGLVPSGSQWLLIGALGIVQMALPYLLFARGVGTVPAQEAALITLLEPILNPLWVSLFFPEPVATSTWIGGAFIVAGLTMRYLFFR